MWSTCHSTILTAEVTLEVQVEVRCEGEKSKISKSHKSIVNGGVDLIASNVNNKKKIKHALLIKVPCPLVISVFMIWSQRSSLHKM